MDGLAGALQGQPGYVVIVVVLIAAVAYVSVKVWTRKGEDGDGRAGLQAIDTASEFLAEKALEERGMRHDAEKDRDAAQSTRDKALADLDNIRTDLEQAQRDLAECDRLAQEAAERAVAEERRRRGTS